MAVEDPEQAPPLADAASRVVDRTLEIVQGELELARLELVQKLPKLGRGMARPAVAALLVAFGGMLVVSAVVWALADYVFGFQNVWAAFAVVAGVVLALAAYLGYGAIRRAREAGPPVPSAAVRQAPALREMLRR